jgi:hypothetical protein
MPEDLDQDFLFEDLVVDDPSATVPEPDPADPPTDPEPDVVPEVNPNDDPDDPGPDPSADPDAPQPPIDPPADPDAVAELSGVERYLAQFDIEGGMIRFDDESEVHFNDLDADKQEEILSQLHGQQATSVEDKFGLDQSEIGLINYLRQNETTVEQMIDQLASERVSTILATQNVGAVDYDKMESDSVYINFLKKSNPEATPEQLEQDLSKAKEQNNFEKLVESVRTQFKVEQQNIINQERQTKIDEQQTTIDSQRQVVIDAAIDMSDIDGVTLNDGTKNTLLDHVLEVNEQGDSLFMEEVFSDPKTLMRAAFWYYNGADLMKQRDDFWKKEKSASFKRGRESALGKSSGKISFRSDSDPKKQTTSTPSQSNDNNYVDLDELHTS